MRRSLICGGGPVRPGPARVEDQPAPEEDHEQREQDPEGDVRDVLEVEPGHAVRRLG